VSPELERVGWILSPESGPYMLAGACAESSSPSLQTTEEATVESGRGERGAESSLTPGEEKTGELPPPRDL